MYFDKQHGVTRLGVFNVHTCDDPHWFTFRDNFFIFHFRKRMQKNEFVVFACVMDDLHMEDFVDLDSSPSNIVRGNIRLKRFHLNTLDNTTKIVQNPYIEHLSLKFPYNLDFPVISTKNRRYIYCTIFDRSQLVTYVDTFVQIHVNLNPGNLVYSCSKMVFTVIPNHNQLLLIIVNIY